MIDFSPTRRRLGEALSLLREERRLLLRGDINGLARFELRRQKLINKLPHLSRDKLAAHQSLVEKVRSTARRNAVLLEAFLDGAREAERKLSELERRESQLGAYREDGSRISALCQETTTSRRA